MADYAISGANLNAIESSLININRNINTVNGNINVVANSLDAVDTKIERVDSDVVQVKSNVQVVYDEVESLAGEFREYVRAYMKDVNEQKSRTELINIRAELDRRFGHYSEVRRHTTGILQANDLGIVKSSTISNVTEELMLSAPGYWLAPNLVALAAWINDQPNIAEKALKEGIKRNDEKTSLFWALICRRAERKNAALRWTQRYLANQDEENLDRVTVIILDAFASGLLGSDSENVVSKQMGEWLERLSEKPGFVEQQTQQWSDAIILKKRPLEGDGYTYLRKYSHTWPVLQDIMEGASLHATILEYFMGIFDREASNDSLKAQLDEILNNLVTEFDEEEIPLRKQEKFHQFVVDFKGDVDLARQYMTIEETSFEEHKDFTQLLTDAAMKPETSHAGISTQKFAIALSKEWISNAYNDVTAQNRMKIPNEIELNVDTFNGVTTDGQNEDELLRSFNNLVDDEKSRALSGCTLSGFEKFCLWGGISIGVIGIIMLFANWLFLGLIAIIASIGMVINHFSKKSKVDANRNNISAQFETKRNNGTQIIRAILAEVVDFRAEFSERDSESQKVLDFLEQISPDQYVKKLSDSSRRINVSE